MTSEVPVATTSRNARATILQRAVWELLLAGILMTGAYFRFVGLDWDGDYHLHPDERFMTMVASSVHSVSSLSQYFNTATSTLNPNNVGYGFYVYGDLPLVLTRYLGELLNQTGYSQINLVGRFLSGLFDLGTVLMVFLIAMRLFKKTRLALLAAAFAALSVLPIQLSHFFTTDTFTNFFIFMGIYFAVRAFTADLPPLESPATDIDATAFAVEADAAGVAVDGGTLAETPDDDLAGDQGDREVLIGLRKSWGSLVPYAWFGVALGLAMSSKVSAAPLAAVIAIAALLYWRRLPEEQRLRWGVTLFRNLVLAAVISFITFRIFQPYAFTGPGFLGIKPNQQWISNLENLAQQSAGDVDFPPALQWARRPVTFAWQNMVEWGLGLPLGLLAWGGFLYMAWRMLKGEWPRYILLWTWTGAYFVWQSLVFSRTMRYQLPVYPALAIIAAWAVFALWERRPREEGLSTSERWRRPLAFGLGAVALIGTFLWAFAFTRIYTRPVTRIAASSWIFQNVPAAINLKINQGVEGIYSQPLPYYASNTATTEQPLIMAFTIQYDGTILEVDLSHVDNAHNDGQLKTLMVTISSDRAGQQVLASGTLTNNFTPADDPRGPAATVQLLRPLNVQKGQSYFLTVEPAASSDVLDLAGPAYIGYANPDFTLRQAVDPPVETLRTGGTPFSHQFSADKGGQVSQVYLPHIVDWEATPDQKTLQLTISGANGQATAEVTSDFAAAPTDTRGQGYTFTFAQPVPMRAGQIYTISLNQTSGPGTLAVYGSQQALESSWDDPLPYSVDGQNVFDYFTGLYRTDLNFEMYWDDNVSKREQMIDNLDQADYLFISSSRQWGSTTRVPERYPLTTAYYRDLIGCPDNMTVESCYNIAQPGMYQGMLGFKLIKVFQSEPNLGPIVINTQPAEEAFTVYDHPKVFIFEKTAAYNSYQVRALLDKVDLSKVQHLTPKKVPMRVNTSLPTLMLPANRLAQDIAGGTWSQLFSYTALQNRFPGFGVVLWYLVVLLLGWAVFPFVRMALRGLPDRGYAVTKVVGVVMLAWMVWIGGSLGVPVSRLFITLMALLLLAVNVVLFIIQKDGLLQDLRERKRYILVVEGLALTFFLVFLFIRLGNPDLWHPYKGGEKPMDFSFLNATIKSTTFPPYDPWFAGGYMNYYYYGFVLMGVLVKWLAVVPSIAYNIFLPMLFSFVAMGAFCFGYNLLARNGSSDPPDEAVSAETPEEAPVEAPGNDLSNGRIFGLELWPLLTGLASAIGLLILGNLGTVRMIWQGWQKLVAPVPIEQGNIIPARGLGRARSREVRRRAVHAVRHRQLVLEPQPCNPGRADHRVPILHLPVRRPARSPDRAAHHHPDAGVRPVDRAR